VSKKPASWEGIKGLSFSLHIHTYIHTYTRLYSTYRLIDPLPRTRNLFLQPLFVLTPPLNRNCDNKWYGDNEYDDSGDTAEDCIINDDDDIDDIDETIRENSFLVVKGEGNLLWHRRTIFLEPQFQSNDILNRSLLFYSVFSCYPSFPALGTVLVNTVLYSRLIIDWWCV
jgi:hypothetical protein